MSVALLDPAAAAAGDVARTLQLLADADWIDVALLRMLPARVCVGCVRRGPRALDAGDVASFLEALGRGYGSVSWPAVQVALLVVEGQWPRLELSMRRRLRAATRRLPDAA